MEAPTRRADDPLVAYLCFQSVPHETGEAEEWAALLVVTAQGLPHEFVYSGPLRPTPVQAILYQDQLAAQLRLSLVRSLLRGLRARPLFVGATPGSMDPAAADVFRLPILIVEEGAASWLASPTPAAEAAAQRLEGVVGLGEPLGRAVAALAYVVEYERPKPRGEEDGG